MHPYPAALEFVDRGIASNAGVLVHCEYGRSRSCAVVLAWLCERRRMTLDEVRRCKLLGG